MTGQHVSRWKQALAPWLIGLPYLISAARTVIEQPIETRPAAISSTFLLALLCCVLLLPATLLLRWQAARGGHLVLTGIALLAAYEIAADWLWHVLAFRTVHLVEPGGLTATVSIGVASLWTGLAVLGRWVV